MKKLIFLLLITCYVLKGESRFQNLFSQINNYDTNKEHYVLITDVDNCIGCNTQKINNLFEYIKKHNPNSNFFLVVKNVNKEELKFLKNKFNNYINLIADLEINLSDKIYSSNNTLYHLNKNGMLVSCQNLRQAQFDVNFLSKKHEFKIDDSKFPIISCRSAIIRNDTLLIADDITNSLKFVDLSNYEVYNSFDLKDISYNKIKNSKAQLLSLIPNNNKILLLSNIEIEKKYKKNNKVYTGIYYNPAILDFINDKFSIYWNYNPDNDDNYLILYSTISGDNSKIFFQSKPKSFHKKMLSINDNTDSLLKEIYIIGKINTFKDNPKIMPLISLSDITSNSKRYYFNYAGLLRYDGKENIGVFVSQINSNFFSFIPKNDSCLIFNIEPQLRMSDVFNIVGKYDEKIHTRLPGETYINDISLEKNLINILITRYDRKNKCIDRNIIIQQYKFNGDFIYEFKISLDNDKLQLIKFVNSNEDINNNKILFITKWEHSRWKLINITSND